MQQLFIDGKLADLGDNTNVSFTIVSNLLKGAADFAGNRTLTVTLPATVHNRTIIRQAQVVQVGGDFAYTFHNVDYWRNGVQIIKGGTGRLTATSPDTLSIAIVWGVRTAVDALLGSDKSLASLATPAYIEFHNDPQVTDYADALVDDVFYAAMDTEMHYEANTFYHTHVVVGGQVYDYTEERPASALLHPSVRMNWLLNLMQSQYGAVIDWDDAAIDIDTMIVPLVEKIPNDTTYNNGYRATMVEPETMGGLAGNFIRFTTSHPSAIIATQSDPPEVRLVCATSFKGLIRYSLVCYINEADLIRNYPIYRLADGYRLGLRVGGAWHWCPILPENMAFTADKIVAGKLTVYVTGYLSVEMSAGDGNTPPDDISMRIGPVHNGILNPEIASDLHVTGGPLYVSEIIGTENEVQPGQLYPVQGNLPDIKPIDLVKFLAAVTGVFPVQASTADTLVMRPVADVFDFSRAVDWSGRLLSITSRPVAKNNAYALDGWAQKNWFRWKEDDTVLGDYDGSIDVDDETIDVERDIITFPFAATDGNNVPMYKKEVNYGEVTETKYKDVEPRVMQMTEGGDGEAVAYFDMDMKRILAERYGHLLATMQRPVVITETIRISDVELSQVDETRAVYLRQHGAYFALLEMAVKQGGTADVKLLKLKKEE